MSLLSTLIGLVKPAGSEPYSLTILNNNIDKIDQNLIAFAFSGIPYVNCSKGALVKNANGKPQSQSISGPNGLTGSMTWSFTSETITETLSITSPTTFTVVKTVTLSDKSETWTVS